MLRQLCANFAQRRDRGGAHGDAAKEAGAALLVAERQRRAFVRASVERAPSLADIVKMNCTTAAGGVAGSALSLADW